jgi:hypothetical protein
VNQVSEFAIVEDDKVNNCNKVPTDDTSPICTGVAGRTLVVPEIPIRLHKTETFVSLGTTLRHILDADARQWAPHSKLPLRRYHAGRLVPVVILSSDDDALDIPLIKGDAFSK